MTVRQIRTIPSNHLQLEHEFLVAAGRRISVKSLLTGKPHPVLQAMAAKHALYQAKQGIQGHQLWDARVKTLFRDMPHCTDFAEVANESWPNDSPEKAADEMYHSWKQSPGHWAAVDGKCAFYGYAMCYNAGKRVWYACGVFAQTRQ